VQETTKKVKATTAKMAKVDGAGMAFVSETIDYGTMHTTQMDNLFLLTMVQAVNYHKYSRFMRLYCTYFSKNQLLQGKRYWCKICY
jgi:hypothetical protein